MESYRKRINGLMNAIVKDNTVMDKDDILGSIRDALDIVSEYMTTKMELQMEEDLLIITSDSQKAEHKKKTAENQLLLMDVIRIMNMLNLECDKYNIGRIFLFPEIGDRELYPDEREVYDIKKKKEAIKDKERAEKALIECFTEYVPGWWYNG